MFEDIFQHLLAILLPRDTWPIIIFGPDGNLLCQVYFHMSGPLRQIPIVDIVTIIIIGSSI